MKLSPSSVFRRGVRRERRLGWPIARSYSPNRDGHEEAQKGTKGDAFDLSRGRLVPHWLFVFLRAFSWQTSVLGISARIAGMFWPQRDTRMREEGKHSICHAAGWSPTGLLCLFVSFRGEIPDASGPKFLRISLRPTPRMGRPV